MPEIFYVSLGERFAFSVTAARIGEENKIAQRRHDGHIEVHAGPCRAAHAGWPSVNRDHHRITLGGIESIRVQKPSLGLQTTYAPVDLLGFAPLRLLIPICLGQGCPVSEWARPYFRRSGPGAANAGARLSVGGHGKIREITCNVKQFIPLPQGLDFSRRNRYGADRTSTIHVFGNQQTIGPLPLE